jgi:hypothetical protein
MAEREKHVREIEDRNKDRQRLISLGQEVQDERDMLRIENTKLKKENTERRKTATDLELDLAGLKLKLGSLRTQFRQTTGMLIGSVLGITTVLIETLIRQTL